MSSAALPSSAPAERVELTNGEAEVFDVVGKSFDGSRTYAGGYRAHIYEALADEIVGRVLDIGAGDGTSTDHWGGDDVVRIDISASSGLDAVADGRQLPFADESFDTILLSAVLEHVPTSDLGDIAEECRRVARPGARVLAGAPMRYPLHDHPHDYQRPKVYGLADLFDSVGFDSITCYRGGTFVESLLDGLFWPYRAVCIDVGVPQAAWAFAPVHYGTVGVAQMFDRLVSAVHGDNPMGTRWHLQSFVVASLDGGER